MPLVSLVTPWWRACFKLPLVVSPGSGALLVLGQVTLREVLNVDDMGTLKQNVLEDDESGEGCVGTYWSGTED